MRIAWQPREVPLVPRAAVARGVAARALARRLAALHDAALAGLSGVAGDDLIAVIGAGDALPWVDGVVYLGRDDRAPALLLPTALAPTVPADWLERALAARIAAPPIGVVVLGDRPAALVALGDARPLDRGRLDAFLTRAAAAEVMA